MCTVLTHKHSHIHMSTLEHTHTWIVLLSMSFFFIKGYFLICLCECITYVWVSLEARRGRQLSWSWSYRQFWIALCRWWEPNLIGKTADVLNHWPMFSAQHYILLHLFPSIPCLGRFYWLISFYKWGNWGTDGLGIFPDIPLWVGSRNVF